ncbi:MAG TPA: CHRD domain-containing protein [Mycobacteriales bacterium]|nr:CHRD domain-containing protein [Mycobacteriales bacterium]
MTRLAPLVLAVPLSFAATGVAFAGNGSATAQLKPVPLNESHASGTATVTVTGDRLDVTVDVHNILANNPHAAHIHFGADALHECPTAAADTDHNGHINTTEGGPAYGPVTVSLTTSGDTSPKSTLAVDRYSTAPGGTIDYSRGSIHVSPAVAKAILNSEAVVVVHGNDYNHDGKYDGKTKSDLDKSLPTEATDPNVCGVLVAAPSGGAATGVGGGSTGTSPALIGLGGALALAAAGTGAVAYRRRTQS